MSPDAVITLEQHFYASSPVGLELTRGFQTVARSKGLADFAALKAHCGYKRPGLPGLPPADQPINWGWFYLDEQRQRVCIHRIGYAGTDEVGRPGNFMAHNLVCDAAALSAIDFDIVSLVNVIRARPDYPLKDRPPEGFARTHHQLLEKYGKDKARLAALEPVTVPVAEVLAERDRADANWKTFADPVLEALRPEGLAFVLAKLMDPPAERRPLLVVARKKDQNQSAFEWHLVELLFALLPAFARRELTFATYEHDLAGLASTTRTGPTPPHKLRRLSLTTAFNEFKAPPGGELGCWVLSADSPGKLSAPQGPAEGLAKAVAARDREGLLAFRERAGEFAFPDESQGLHIAWQLHQAAGRGTWSPAEYALFDQLADWNRPGCFWLLEQGPNLIEHAEANGADLTGLARGYLLLAAARLGELSGEELRRQLGRLGGALPLMFRWGAAPGCDGLMQRLLVMFTRSPALIPAREAAIDALGRALKSVSARGIGDMADVLVKAQAECSSDDPTAQEFLDRAAQQLAETLTVRLARADGSDRQYLRGRLGALAEMWARCPVTSADALLGRLEALDAIDPGQTGDRGRFMLDRLLSRGRVAPAVLEQLRTRPEPVLLRYVHAFAGLDGPAAGIIGPALQQPSLLRFYWQEALREPGTPLNGRLNEWLFFLKPDSGNSPACAAVASLFAREGVPAIGAGLEALAANAEPTALADFLATQAALTGFALEHLPPGQDPGPLYDHVRALLVETLSLPAARVARAPDKADRPDPRLLPLLAPVLELALHVYQDVASRAALMEQAAAMTAERLGPSRPALLPEFNYVLHRHLGSAEALWHVQFLNQLCCKQHEESAAAVSRSAAFKVLQLVPALAEPGSMTGQFAAWFARHLTPDLWAEVERRLVEDCSDPERRARWLGPQAPYLPLLNRLATLGVLSRAGDLIGRHLRARPEGAGGLVAVLEAGPPEALAAPIRSALAQKVSDDWAVLAQNQPPHTQPPADWRPTSAGQLRTALDLCRALEQVRPGLDGEWFRFFWRYLGACLARLQAEDLRRRFPQVWALTGRYAEVLGGDDLAAARLLLVPLARRGGEQFLSIFSHLGESLVAEGRVDDARRLAALRDDPQFAPCFFRDPPPDAVLQADREDLLRPILAVVPEAARSGNLVPDAARAALQNRGMWAALALASEPTTLAEVCGELCYAGGDGTGRSFHAEMLAVVLLGVLGRHGFGHADVHRLATGLIEGRFFSKLAEACPDDKDRQSVRAALISYLRDRRLPDERLFATVKAIKAAGF